MNLGALIFWLLTFFISRDQKFEHLNKTTGDGGPLRPKTKNPYLHHMFKNRIVVGLAVLNLNFGNRYGICWIENFSIFLLLKPGFRLTNPD